MMLVVSFYMLQVENQFNMMLVVGFYMLQAERSLQFDASY
jgi:hypothetical protein